MYLPLQTATYNPWGCADPHHHLIIAPARLLFQSFNDWIHVCPITCMNLRQDPYVHAHQENRSQTFSWHCYKGKDGCRKKSIFVFLFVSGALREIALLWLSCFSTHLEMQKPLKFIHVECKKTLHWHQLGWQWRWNWAMTVASGRFLCRFNAGRERSWIPSTGWHQIYRGNGHWSALAAHFQGSSQLSNRMFSMLGDFPCILPVTPSNVHVICSFQEGSLYQALYARIQLHLFMWGGLQCVRIWFPAPKWKPLTVWLLLELLESTRSSSFLGRFFSSFMFWKVS